MPRYDVDPSAALGRGIRQAGGAFADVILARRKAAAEEGKREQVGNVLDEAFNEAEQRGAGADFLTDPYALAKWAREQGHWDELVKSGNLGEFFKAASWFHGPMEKDETWVAATPEKLAEEFGGKPSDYPGTWRISSKSRRPEQITRPAEVKEPEAPKTRTREVGNEQITEEWSEGKWHEVGRAPRWQAKEAPEAVDQLSASQVEELYGLEPGALKGRIFQRNRVTGRLSEVGSKDPLAAFMALTGPTPAADQSEEQPSLLERAKKAVGLGKKPSVADDIRNRFK